MRKSLIGLTAFLAIAISCNKSQDPDLPIKGITEEKVLVKDAVYFAGTLPSSVDEALHRRFVNIASNPSQAEIIILRSSDLQVNESMVKGAWENGKTIVEVNPDYASHKKFWATTDAPDCMMEPDDGLLLLARRDLMCYVLQDPFVLEGFLSNNDIEEDKEASASNENLEDEDKEVVDFDEEVEYLDSKLDSFVEWLNENSLLENAKEEVPEYMEFEQELSKFIESSSFTQTYVRSLPVGADDYQLCKVKLSKPDKVSRHSTLDVKITITPLYAYEMNGNDSGDYYFVTADVNSRNHDLFGKYTKKHGGIQTYAFAFFSEDIHWTADLGVEEGVNTVEFFKDPMPQTTMGATTYGSGFSAALNVTGQGGAMGDKASGNLTIGGTFTWNNSISRDISDLEISQKTRGSMVDYDYICRNFTKNDDVNKAVPLIARSDQNCYASWCWHVKGTKDNDTTTKFTFNFTVDPKYGYMYRHGTWGAEGHIKHDVHLLADTLKAFSFFVTPPDRTETGVLEFMSTYDYVRAINIYDESTGKAVGKRVQGESAALKKNGKVNCQLPKGTYKVMFELRAGDGTKIGDYVIEGVEVRTGETTRVASLEGERIKDTI